MFAIPKQKRRWACLVLTATVASLALMGCDGADPAASPSATADAYTVPNGDRYVESADAELVVLKKSVDGEPFPFKADAMIGKAILIHPVKAKLETGLYARVISVEELDSVYRLETKPLLLEEMDAIVEDDIIRIYIDRQLTSASRNQPAAAAFPDLQSGVFDFDTNVAPQAWGGALTGELPLEGEIGNLALVGNVRVSQPTASMSLRPQARVGWERARGLELGFKFDYQWQSTLAFDADFSAGFSFSTPPVRTPTTVVVVPIGPVPVPVTLGLAGYFECRAVTPGTVRGKVAIKVKLAMGGSSFIKPSLGGSQRWVTPGLWPWTASGSATVERDGAFALEGGAEVECLVPRIDLETLVAGVAGPFLTVAPAVEIGGEGLEIGVEVKAGVKASLFGREARGEVILLSWSPD